MYQLPMMNPKDIKAVADWIELYATVHNQNYSKTDASAEIEQQSVTEPSEDFIASVWQELQRREKLYGANPPFKIHSRTIEPLEVGQGNLPYLMCLLLSVFGNPENTTETGKLFERISEQAIKTYYDAKTLIYGHPANYSVEDIAELLCEKFNCRPHSDFKDRGLDIIAWKPFDDGRPGQLIMLFQCAAGHNWKSKLCELPLNAWSTYISFGCTPPTKGFLTAQLVTDVEKFFEHSLESGLLFDRARIFRCINADNIPTQLYEDIEKWCNDKLSFYNS